MLSSQVNYAARSGKYSLAMAKLEKLADGELGRRMKQVREDRGLKLEEVAEVMGITPQALSQIETGLTANPKLEGYLRFCAKYGEDPFALALGRSLSSVVGRLKLLGDDTK